MKKICIYNYSNIASLVSSIVFLILGVILFTNPGGIVKFISYIIGASLVIIGVGNILSYQRTLKKLNVSIQSKLINGIILIILGLISIFFASTIETALRLIIGAWIIYSGILRLIDCLNYQKDKISFIVRLSLSIIMILFGLYIILKTNLVFAMIGLCLIIYSILEIIGFVMYSKKN